MTVEVSQFRNLIEALDAAPAELPFLTVWVDEDEQKTVTFGEFRRQARVQAMALRNEGMRVGDRVVILMPQTLSAMTMFVATMMLGALPAFLAYPNFKIEPSKYRSGLEGVTANLKAKVVVIDAEFPDELLGHVSIGGETRLFRVSQDSGSASVPGLPEADILADSTAFIQHSAGTTGLQKGVALTHAAVLRQLGHLAAALGIDAAKRGPADCIYSWLPLYHDMGLIACFMLPMVCHLHVVMQSPLDWVMHPETMLQIITEHKCTLAWMPNFAFQFVPRRTSLSRGAKYHRAKYDLSSLRALINCSEPVRSQSMEEFQEAFSTIGLKDGVLHSSYAMAENVFAVTQSDCRRGRGPNRVWLDGKMLRNAHQIVPVAAGDEGAISFTSSGRLLPNNEVRILSEMGGILGSGQVGEILIRSDSLFTGYYNRPELTAEVIVDGWYHSGDLGFCLEDELYVVGRKKDLLIIGGENLYPHDIEEIVCSHPAIHDGRAVALGVYNADVGTEEIVVVAEVDHEELLANRDAIEREVRNLVVGGIGVAVKKILLKPPQWLVKSTAGKASRSGTHEKLARENPELRIEAVESERA